MEWADRWEVMEPEGAARWDRARIATQANVRKEIYVSPRPEAREVRLVLKVVEEEVYHAVDRVGDLVKGRMAGLEEGTLVDALVGIPDVADVLAALAVHEVGPWDP